MDRLNKINSGAKFVRSDMHIHSYGKDGSYDVKDNQLTPENIIDTSIEKKLSIISITDHNEIGNVKRAIEYAMDKNILLIPGIEVSTIQGHLLLFFETYLDLKNFFGKLTISEDKERCTQGIVECLNLAGQFNGIGILAHIDLASGFEQTIGKFGPQMEDVLTHPNLWGFEISLKESNPFYTEGDENSDRKRLLNLRREKLSLNKDYDFPKLMSSDSHTLNKLGTNAEGNNRLTRIKVDSLNFQAFKIALMSSNSRIRLEDFIPERVPHFIGITIDGGLLDKQDTKFSKNLTCIIGGRGAGKSTLLETVRETSGNLPISNIIDSEVWPEKITLWFEDETGQIFKLSREKNSEVINDLDPANGVTKIQIESYGQGETANTIQHSDKNPQVLIKFLDNFIDLKSIQIEEEEVRNLLITNQTELNKLRIEVSNIPETEKQKKLLESKQEQLKKDKAGDLVKYQTALLREREIRKSIIIDLKGLIERYRNILSDSSVFKNFELLTDDEIIVGKEYFIKVKAIVSEFSKIVETKSNELNVTLNEKIKELNVEINSWSEKEKTIQEKIDAKKAELESKGIPFDLGKINQIAQELIYYQKRLHTLQQRNEELKELQKKRIDFLKSRIELKNKIYFQRLEFANTVNENLKNTVDGFFVTIKYKKGAYSPQFENSIKTLMQWKTARVSKAEYLAKDLSPLDFALEVRKKKLDILKNILDSENERVFPDSEISNVLNKCLENNNFEDFESLTFEDNPSIIVTKYISSNDEEQKIITRYLSQLSLGQQQSILLAILLQSKSKVPLIIDQPEDNLDSEFIYKTIVENLRRIKEKRQVIVVTHNPNIAVLGDAELIVPLKSTSIKSTILNRGSIDRKETRSMCCDILEGGKQAFSKRKEIYGI